MEKIFPSFIHTGGTTTIKLADGTTEDIPNIKSLSYESLVVPLVSAVQNLSEGMTQLHDANNELRKENMELRNELIMLKQEIDLIKSKDIK